MHSLRDNVVTSACRTNRTAYADVPSSRIVNCIFSIGNSADL